MIDFILPNELPLRVAQLVREHRISQNLTQAKLAERSNVSLAVLKKFEATGKVSLESFVRLAFALGLTEKLLKALAPTPETFSSLDEVIADHAKPNRQRAYSLRKKKDDQ